MLDREAEVIKNLKVILILFLRAMHQFFSNFFDTNWTVLK